MKRQSGRTRTSSLSGFSLMEVLIVLAILIAVSAMAAPALIDRIKDSNIQESAESVREIVSEARTYAIDSGIDYQFRFETMAVTLWCFHPRWNPPVQTPQRPIRRPVSTFVSPRTPGRCLSSFAAG